MTTYDCVSSLPLPYGIRVTTITWLRTTVWAACTCPTAYALHDYVGLREQLTLVLPHTRYYFYITTYYCVSSPTHTRYYYYVLCEQPALALRHTHYYYCVSSLPLPYGIRVTTITWLRTTLWAACPCPTSYALLLLHYYVLLCEQLALALRHTCYYYYITKYYFVSSLPLPYGIRVTTFTWLRTTEWAACPCPTACALLLLNDYVRLCEQLALALRHTRYYYYMTTYDCVSSLPLPYGLHVTTITSLRTTVWAAFSCPTAYALLLLNDYVLPFEQPSLALRHTRYYYYITTYYCVSSRPLGLGLLLHDLVM